MNDVTNLNGVAATGDGVAWSAEPTGVNVNLVVLRPRAQIAEHRNDSVGVLVVVIEGSAVATLDGAAHALTAGDALVIEPGTVRGVTAGHDGVRYLTVHAARGPMQIGPRR